MTATPLLLLVLLLATADATFRFASYYGNHMVLQQKPARAVVWGFGEVGAPVTVTLKRGIDTISEKTVNVDVHIYITQTAGTHSGILVTHPGRDSSAVTHTSPLQNIAPTYLGDVGVWKLLLDPMDYGGPYQLIAQQTIKNDITTIILEDVLFGDVWFCGGQSNMAMSVSQIHNASQEAALAAQYPNVRLFTASREKSDTELLDLAKVDLEWSLPTPQILGHGDFQYFSAVCWIFGRQLAQWLKYPIGLVESVWSGTLVEAWSSKTALSKCGLSQTPAEIQRCYQFMDIYGGPCVHSALWNAMIHPLLNMTIKGAIWYQGEQNTNTNPNLYNCTFPALIEDWRRSFHEGSLGQTDPNFPFGFVQLSTCRKTPPKDNFPMIRWHQTADYGYAPNPKMRNTFMAVAMDLVDEAPPYGSVHPRDKQTVAYRLYLGAQAIAYGDCSVNFQGPFHENIDICYTDSYMNITYNQELLITRTFDDIFEVLCSSGVDLNGKSQYSWVPALAQSSSSKVVTVEFKGCSDILAVRYAWSDWPCEYKQCPIYSAQGRLPAPIFIKYFK